MLIFNTTYHLEDENERLFLIWLQEFYLPAMEKDSRLTHPRIARILSHRDAGTCISLQFEVENSATLHRWHQELGVKLNDELVKTFKDKVVGFPTLMEVIL